MLNKSALGWPKIAGLGVALVIAGQFSGWNFGLAAGGWTNMLAATLLMAALCSGLALCVAELSTAMPNAGGVFSYAQSAFGPFVGYLVGIATALALIIGTGAAATFVSAYTESVLGIGGWPVKLALFALIIGIHIRGVGEALGLTLLAGAIAVIALLIFGATMLPFVNFDQLSSAATGTKLSLQGVFTCIPFAIWLFITVEQTGSAAEEARNPGRDMPKGILAAVGVLLLTAMTVLICAPAAGGVELVGSANDPLYAAMTSPSALGRDTWLATVVGLGALFGLIATFFSLTYAGSRQLFAMARDGHLPALLARTNPRGTPHNALAVTALIGLPMSMVAPETILVAVVLLLNLCYLFLFAAYLQIRRCKPDMPRPFRFVGGTWVAFLGLLLTLVVIAACFQLEWTVLLTIAGTLSLFAISFVIQKQRPQTTPTLGEF